MSLETGELIDNKYRIVKLIGEGGMGAVYEGENVRISRRVAIKVLHAGLTANEEVAQRFEREAQAAGRIGNDHILEVIDLGTLANGDRFIVMEFLDGEPLSSRISAKKRLQPLELASLIRQSLVGLGAAHRAGIVHRDLKPDNIYILKHKAGHTDFVKIIDFGISKFQPLSGDGMKMTRTGAVMGTPYYMSPEQASGSHEADQRSDLYSIGVIMFEAVTGQVPFDASTFNQLMFKIVLSDVPRPEALVPDLDPAFASLISKAMARDANQRFQSADDFIRGIDGWLQSGAAVTIPPTADPAAAALLPQGARTGLGAAAPGPGTAGSWAKTSDEVVPSKKGSSVGLIAGLVVGLVVVGGGVAYAVLGGGNKQADAAPPSAAAAAEPPAPAVTAAKPAEPTPAVAPVPAPVALPDAPASAAPSASAAAAVAAPARPVGRPGAARPPSVPKPAPAKPSQKPGSTPDFGY
jgi:eukaryotic-like serine/threonine-protein kinase